MLTWDVAGSCQQCTMQVIATEVHIAARGQSSCKGLHVASEPAVRESCLSIGRDKHSCGQNSHAAQAEATGGKNGRAAAPVVCTHRQMSEARCQAPLHWHRVDRRTGEIEDAKPPYRH